MFHSENGLFLSRANKAGAVRIIKTNDGKSPGIDNVVLDQILPPGIWCSIISTVSDLGEEGGRWYKAMDWHTVVDEGI